MLLCFQVLWAQQHVGFEELRMAPRPNVATYDDANDIEHLQYRQSSYYEELDFNTSIDGSLYVPVYTGTVEVDKSWHNDRVFFRYQATPGYALFINDKLIGVSRDGCSVTEYDITTLIRFGRTYSFAIRLVDSLANTVLDRPKQQPGLVGNPVLLYKPSLNVRDYTLSTDYNSSTGIGDLHLDLELYNGRKRGKCYLEVELWNPQGHQIEKAGKWILFSKRNNISNTISTTLSEVSPWSAESPRLYTLVIRLYNEKKEVQDIVGTKFGFRSLGSRTSVRINDKDITLRGITWQMPIDLSSEGAEELLREQMAQMKCNNINAIRTCGGGPAPERFYELCDEMGFYVVCDANLFPQSTMGHAVATDNNYEELFVDRMRNLYGRYKNHTCIIAWSLGECKDNGTCMFAAYNALRQLDDSRPILYSGAQYSDNTDLIAPEECNIDCLRQYLAKSQPRHLVMLSFGSASGNNLGGLQSLWQSVMDHEKIQGGFFQCQDWNSIANLPYIKELKQIYSPIQVRLSSTSDDAAEFEIVNRSDFLSMQDYRLDYTLCTNLKPNIVSGDVAISLFPGQSKVFKVQVPKMTLYSGEELSACFSLRQRGKNVSIPKNTELYRVQMTLPSANVPQLNFSAAGLPDLILSHDTPHHYTVSNSRFSLCFDDSLGAITSMYYLGQEILVNPLQLSFVRVPSPNDRVDPNGARQWQRYEGSQGLDCEVVASNCRLHPDHTVGIDVLLRYGLPDKESLFDVRQTYRILPTGDVLVNNVVDVSAQIKSVARVGMRMGVAQDLSTIEWLGRDIESYIDRRCAGQIVQQRRPVSELFYRYHQLQHAGNHTDVRWLSLYNDTVGLYVDILDTNCQFSVYPYDDDTLLHTSENTQWSDIRALDYWNLHVDYRQTGVGGATGSILLDESSLLKDRRYQFTLHLRPYERDEYNAQDFRRIAYPQVVSSIIEMPVIEKSRDRFDAAMSVSITCPTPGVEIHYTLDGSTPTEQSPRYSKPFTITTSTIVRARAFKKGESPSFVTTERFSFDYIESCTFRYKPNTPYNRNADKVLVDGELGDVNDLSRGWLGFSGHDVQVDLHLGHTIEMNSLTVRFAHVPDAWVFAPAVVTVAVSEDGVNYSDPIPAVISYNAADESMNTTQLMQITIPVNRSGVRHVRLVAKPISHIPQWHRAKGLNPWIMMDEIKIEEEIAQ